MEEIWRWCRDLKMKMKMKMKMEMKNDEGGDESEGFQA